MDARISEGNIQAAAALAAKEICEVLEGDFGRGEKYANTPQKHANTSLGIIQIIIEQAIRNRVTEPKP